MGLLYIGSENSLTIAWDNCGKCHMDEDSMLVKRIAASIFNRLRAIARYWSEIATFSYPLHLKWFNAGIPIGIPGESLVLRKLESWGYYRQWKQFDDRLSRFDTTSVWRTDRQTDRRPAYINNVRSNTDALWNVKIIINRSNKMRWKWEPMSENANV